MGQACGRKRISEKRSLALHLEGGTAVRWMILPEVWTISAIFLRLYFNATARDILNDKAHEQGYLISELESLGLTSVRLNEFNDNGELHTLVSSIKEALLAEYRGLSHLDPEWALCMAGAGHAVLATRLGTKPNEIMNVYFEQSFSLMTIATSSA